MIRISRAALMAATVVAAAMTLGPEAGAQQGVKAGMLTCNESSGWGLIFGSSRELKCVFSQDGSHYIGHIRQFGVDIGYQAGGVIAWAVFAPTNNVGRGALAGDYGGVSGSATAGVGVGVNVLTGGFQQSFALQPLSVEGTVGLNVAGGIAQMSLEYQPQAN